MKINPATISLLLLTKTHGFVQAPLSLGRALVSNNHVDSQINSKVSELYMAKGNSSQENFRTAFTAAAIFVATASGAPILSIENAYAATSPTTPVATKLTNSAADPLAKEKAIIAKAKDDIESITKSIKALEIDIEKEKALQTKAKNTVQDAETKLADRKSAYLYANDAFVLAKAKDTNPRSLAGLQDRVTKAKDAQKVAEDALKKVKDDEISISKDLSVKVSRKSEQEKSLSVAKNSLSTSEAKLKALTDKLAKEQKIADEKRIAEAKKKAEDAKKLEEKQKQEQQKQKEIDAKNAKIAAEKSKQQEKEAAIAATKSAEKAKKDAEIAQKKAKEETAKRQKEKLKAAEEATAQKIALKKRQFAVKEAEGKLKSLEFKKANSKSLSVKELKKLDVEISKQTAELKKLKQVAAKAK